MPLGQDLIFGAALALFGRVVSRCLEVVEVVLVDLS